MTRIDIQVVGASITAKVNGKLTSGQIGAQAYFSFSPEWSGLNKIAVFRGSGKVKDRALAGGNSTTIPWEVLTQPNTRLEIGVEGRNADGSIVFPTVWCFADSVAPGANAVADPGIAPTPNVYDDIMAAVGNLPGLKTEAKENLVAAINELYERGGGSADPEAVANLVEQYLKEHPPAPGEDGYSPTITTAAITGGTRLTITDKNGTKTVDVMNGAKGDTGPTGPEGPAGATGADGYTPVKGKDYYTEADKQEIVDEISEKAVLKSATVSALAPVSLYGVDYLGNPRKFDAAAGSTSVARKIPYYTDRNTLKSGTPTTSDDVTPKGYVDSNFMRANPQEAQEPPLFLFGSDSGGVSSFKASWTPVPDAVPYYDNDGVLHSGDTVNWNDDEVVNLGFLRNYRIYPLNLYYENDRYVFYDDQGDMDTYDNIYGHCYDGYKLCVIHEEIDDTYRQIVGMRIGEDGSLYFGNNEYKMTSDNVITRLSEPKMELLETITIDSTSPTVWERTNYTLDALRVISYAPKQATTGTIKVRAGSSSFGVQFGSDFQTATKTDNNFAIKFCFTKNNGAWDYDAVWNVPGWGSSTYSNENYRQLLESDLPHINRFVIYNNSSTPMPVGTTISIYGVRANEN